MLIIYCLRRAWRNFLHAEHEPPTHAPYPLDDEEWAAAQENMAQWQAEGDLLRQAKEKLDQK